MPGMFPLKGADAGPEDRNMSHHKYQDLQGEAATKKKWSLRLLHGSHGVRRRQAAVNTDQPHSEKREPPASLHARQGLHGRCKLASPSAHPGHPVGFLPTHGSSRQLDAL